MRFYVLKSVVGSSHETDAEKVDPYYADAEECRHCGDWVSMRKWLPPLSARVHAYGSGLGDIAFSTGDDLLVSDRLLDAWRRENLTGLRGFEPVDIVGVRPKRLAVTAPRYFRAIAVRTTTRVDEHRSVIVRSGELVCTHCMARTLLDLVNGCSIDLTTWTGEDIFEAENLGGVTLVSNRVLELRDKYGLTNMPLTPAEDYVWDPHRRLGKNLS